MSSSSSKSNSLPSPVTQSEKKSRYAKPVTDDFVHLWVKLKRRCGTTPPEENADLSGGSLGELDDYEGSDSESARPRRKSSMRGPRTKEEREVDEVVVDNPAEYRDWRAPDPPQDDPASPKQHSAEMEKSGGNASRSSSIVDVKGKGVVFFLRWRFWPSIRYFFDPSFADKDEEEVYQRELWFSGKSTVILGTMFLVVSWIFAVTLLPHPWSQWNKIQNYILGPVLSVPLVPMAVFDLPRRRKWCWQILLLICIYIDAAGNIIDMNLCHYYGANRNCANRDFLSTLYYASALPMVGLFFLRQNRALAVFGAIAWIILVGCAVLPHRVAFIRNVLNIALFQAMVLYAHFRADIASRRMWSLKEELKRSFRAKAYIFHEVRSPLNTALLSVQNLEAANVFKKDDEFAEEYTALSGSLTMMRRVLNDVLDFNRMETGGFMSVSLPFSFHTVMRSILGTVKLDAETRGLLVEADFDSSVDEAAQRAACLYENVELVKEGEGIVMGDEMRLRQVITNLSSNAAKFTPSGGKISIRTKLLYPGYRSDHSTLSAPLGHDASSDRLSANCLRQHDSRIANVAPRSDVLVVRIEVEDTGVGIKSADAHRLFSAYVQTEVGRQQGGKGTGLGLSLCRHIVALSGGRLGMKSRVGYGTTMFVEMPFFIGPQTRQPSSDLDQRAGHLKVPVPSPDSSFDNLPRPSPAPDSSKDHGSFDFGGGYELNSLSSRLESPGASPPLSSGASHAPSSLYPAAPPLALVRPIARGNLSSSSAHTLATTGSGPSAKLDFADGPLRVLTVDDDTLTRRLMERMMVRLGCVVSQAENGLVALDKILAPPLADVATSLQAIPETTPARPSVSKNFDIIFLDNQMPKCSGLEVVSKLRELGRDDCVIGCTANAQKSDQDEYLQMGASYVLTKPVAESDLRHFLVIADQRRRAAIEGRPLTPTT